MSKIIISPSKYVQGKGELTKFGIHAKSLGKKFLIIASPNGIKRTKTILEKSCKNFNIQLIFEPFNGECCKEEIDRLVAERDMLKDELSNERNENKKQQLKNHIKELENEIKQFRIKLSKIN